MRTVPSLQPQLTRAGAGQSVDLTAFCSVQLHAQYARTTSSSSLVLLDRFEMFLKLRIGHPRNALSHFTPPHGDAAASHSKRLGQIGSNQEHHHKPATWMPANATSCRSRTLQATPIGHRRGWRGCAARLATAVSMCLSATPSNQKVTDTQIMVVYLRFFGWLPAAAKGTNMANAL